MSPRKTVLAIVVFSFCGSNTAFAHAHLVTASPQPQGTVMTAPSEVSISFTEELEAKASSIKVEDAQGVEVDSGDVHGDPRDAKHLAVSLKPLQPGTYKVIWNATASDTHKTNGTYTFKVMG